MNFEKGLQGARLRSWCSVQPGWHWCQWEENDCWEHFLHTLNKYIIFSRDSFLYTVEVMQLSLMNTPESTMGFGEPHSTLASLLVLCPKPEGTRGPNLRESQSSLTGSLVPAPFRSSLDTWCCHGIKPSSFWIKKNHLFCSKPTEKKN